MFYNYILLVIIIVLIIFIFYNKSNINRRINEIEKVIEEVKKGNLNSRILIRNKDYFSNVEYKINEFTELYQKENIKTEKNNLIRKQLLSDLSHDIRTPITSIIGHLDAIVNLIVTSPEEINDYILKANNRARQLKILLDDIFEYAKADANELKIVKRSLDLNELIRDIFIQYVPILETEGIKLKTNIPEQKLLIFADEFCIRRAIQNLIDNSMQHGKSGKVIGLDVQNIDKNIYIDVWDKGPGINKDEKEKVFLRLFKKSNSMDSTNHGLGLAISRKLIENNGGNIELDSIPYTKTTFRIIFPELRNN